jgi:hypothetical protein
MTAACAGGMSSCAPSPPTALLGARLLCAEADVKYAGRFPSSRVAGEPVRDAVAQNRSVRPV